MSLISAGSISLDSTFKGIDYRNRLPEAINFPKCNLSAQYTVLEFGLRLHWLLKSLKIPPLIHRYVELLPQNP